MLLFVVVCDYVSWCICVGTQCCVCLCGCLLLCVVVLCVVHVCVCLLRVCLYVLFDVCC